MEISNFASQKNGSLPLSFDEYVAQVTRRMDNFKMVNKFDRQWEKLCKLIKDAKIDGMNNLKIFGFNKDTFANELQTLKDNLGQFNYYYELEGKVHAPSWRKQINLFSRNYAPVLDTVDRLHRLLYQIYEEI